MSKDKKIAVVIKLKQKMLPQIPSKAMHLGNHLVKAEAQIIELNEQEVELLKSEQCKHYMLARKATPEDMAKADKLVEEERKADAAELAKEAEEASKRAKSKRSAEAEKERAAKAAKKK